jgi:hypothetical protein
MLEKRSNNVVVQGGEMKLKIKWRKRKNWEEARAGMFEFSSDSYHYGCAVRPNRHEYIALFHGKCKNIADGKRKAERWIIKQFERMVEV